MDLKTKTRLEDLISSIEQKNISVNTDRYSPTLEYNIQTAVSYKREGNYDKAIEIYLDIFKQIKCVNSNIAAFMFKVIICAEEFYLAYKLITLVETEVIKRDGPRAPLVPFPGGPVLGYIKWAHTEYKENLVLACKQSHLNNNINYLLEYVRPYAGNPTYTFKKSSAQILSEITKII